MPKNSPEIEGLKGHSSTLISKARKIWGGNPFKQYCERFEPKPTSSRSQPEIPEEANPDGSYLVGGEIIPGSEFPGGILPANAVRIPEEDIPQEIDSS